jgi:8-oxo-dGTP diphosphatase
MNVGADYPGISISYFCHDGKGNVLLNLRSENCRDECGRWDNGGGGLDLGMTVEETLAKEVKEEYCADILEKEFLGYYEAFREQDGKKTHWLALFFKVRIDPVQARNGEPHKFDDVRWFKFGEFPQPLHSQFMSQYEAFKDKLL